MATLSPATISLADRAFLALKSLKVQEALIYAGTTMATKVPGSTFRRFVDDRSAPESIKKIDNKRELILMALCGVFGSLVQFLAFPLLMKHFPNLQSQTMRPVARTGLMVAALFMAEGFSRLLAGQKNLYAQLTTTTTRSYSVALNELPKFAGALASAQPRPLHSAPAASNAFSGVAMQAAPMSASPSGAPALRFTA